MYYYDYVVYITRHIMFRYSAFYPPCLCLYLALHRQRAALRSYPVLAACRWPATSASPARCGSFCLAAVTTSFVRRRGRRRSRSHWFATRRSTTPLPPSTRRALSAALG